MKWTILVVISIGLAGCATQVDDAGGEPDLIIDPERPDTSFGDVETGPVAEPDLNATTEAAPKLIAGEWWRIQFESDFDTGLVEVVRVVADVNEDGYIFGMPHEGWLKEAISFHSPAFGDVNADLSYNTHNELFQPLKFPLVEGDSWTTSFATSAYTATVESATTEEAVIQFTPIPSSDPTTPLMEALGLAGGGDMRLTYDARQHEVVRMESALGTWQVVEHGYDFEGWVTVPRGEDTAIDYGTFGPVSESHNPLPRQLSVDGEFNRMTMMQLVGTPDNVPAYAKLRHLTPGDEEWTSELQGAGFSIRYFETNQPVGEWTVEDTAAGAAFTYSMGIAYLQYDISLPDGARRADHGHQVIR